MAGPSRVVRLVGWTALLLLVVAVVLLGLTGYQALKARTALNRVAADFEKVSGQLESGEERAARATVTDAQRHARVARANTDGPGWWLAGKLPVVGPDVVAVQTVAQVSDRVSTGVLPDVITAAGTLRPERLLPVDGRIDLAPVHRAEPAVIRAATRLAKQAEVARAIDVGPLVSQVAGPVRRLQTRITRADKLADRAARAVRLLPGMLGANGPRHYLFTFQNNAEIRATGGIPGSFALLTATDGRLELGKQGGARSIGAFAAPVIPLTAQELSAFGTAMGRLPQSANYTPDFPRTGQLLDAMWRRRNGSGLDGVVSVDPVALSYVLRGTGPVTTAGNQTLSAGNAVDLLLSKVYAEIPEPPLQNVFFEAAARDVFAAVSGGKGKPRALLSNVVRSASERRILVWSSHPDEQRLLDPTAVGGAFSMRQSRTPSVGVYLNSARPSKIEYYLDYRASVRSLRCVVGRQHLRTTINLRSRVPRKHSFLTQYVAPTVGRFERAVIVVKVYVFVPVGGAPGTLRVDGKPTTYRKHALGSRRLALVKVGVRPQQHLTVTVDMTTGPHQSGTPRLRATPGVRSTGVGSVGASSCS